jgi:hypothetical protein
VEARAVTGAAARNVTVNASTGTVESIRILTFDAHAVPATGLRDCHARREGNHGLPEFRQLHAPANGILDTALE